MTTIKTRITKDAPKHSLLELAGIWPPEEVEKLRTYIKERRRASRKRRNRIARMLNEKSPKPPPPANAA